MKKIKILYTGMSGNMGGIETFLINIIRNIDLNKFEISLLVYDSKNICFLSELKKYNVKIYEIHKRTKNYFKYISDAKKIFKEKDFDYIHFNLMSFSCFELIKLAQKYSKAQIILHSHIAQKTRTSIKNSILDEIGRNIVKNKDTYIKYACSKVAGDYLFNGFRNPEYIEINNAINIDNYIFNIENRKKIRTELGIKDDEILIGNIGRFVKQKNHKLLIKIYQQYVKKNKRSKLLLIGEGPLKDEIRCIVKKLQIENNVIFLERRNDVNVILQGLDIFIMTSLYEGLPFVLVEAQASGLPCVISNTISDEINITKESNVVIGLDCEVSYWCNQIEELYRKKINRASNGTVVENSKFNIKNEIKNIESNYIKFLK